MTILMLAFVCAFGPLMIHKARQHDRCLEPVEPIDYDALAEEQDTRDTDDGDSYRKGES
ncbi:hypothetical protein [Paenarthrobacter nicotinovorans]|uniref:hypothetical protein n=1 Tax=Paenarthrobacter nicotinovorans TaxID=29320 RepID=UPI0039A52623